MAERDSKRMWMPTKAIGGEAKKNLTKQTATIRGGRKNRQDSSINISEVDVNATRFRDLAEFAQEIGEEEFLKTFPHPFLIQKNQTTRNSDSDFFTLEASGSRVAMPVTLNSAILYRLVKKDKSSFQHMITVGRGKVNDVFIDDHRVSKFHAYFSQSGQNWSLTDAGSTNGTYLKKKLLDRTISTPLQFDDEISFSENLLFIFIENKKLFKLLKMARLDQ